MIESHDPYNPLHEIESLIRDAGNYVQPSDDLRPRVMEAVRSQRVERVAQRRIWQSALWFCVLSVLVMSTLPRIDFDDGLQPAAAQASSGDPPPGPTAARDGESWDAVDSFRAIRRRHAELLRLHL